MPKRWTIIGAALGAAAGLLGFGYYWLLRRPLARTQGTVRLPGLLDEVEILRDRWGIPHIYAQNSQDLMFAQGFVHAQDRLWQMDYQRRVVAGRLAEILGEQAVPVDRWLRILGMRRTVEQEVDILDDDIRADVEAYAAGVNARIAQGRLPIEFTLLRYEPEPWTAVRAGIGLGMEAPIRRIPVLRRAGRAEREDRHAGVGAVIRDGADDAEPGSAMGAVGEGVTVAAVGRIEYLVQTIQAGCHVRRDERSPGIGLAVANAESLLVTHQRDGSGLYTVDSG